MTENPRMDGETEQSPSDADDGGPDGPQAEADTGASEATSGEAGARPARRRKRGGRSRNAQYWMLVSSPENLRKTREHGFSIQGVKKRHRRRVEAMRPGDRLLYYVTGRMAFAASVTVTSPLYEDHTPIWRSARRDEDYPWRVHIRGEVVLDDADWVTAKDVAFRLEYVRKWPPEHWTLAFQGHLHQLPQKDFALIEGELERSRRRRSVAS
jgi:predicted RNA-binding protein